MSSSVGVFVNSFFSSSTSSLISPKTHMSKIHTKTTFSRSSSILCNISCICISRGWSVVNFPNTCKADSDKLLSFFVIQGKKPTVLNRLRIGHSYLTHSFILRREEAPVCVACGAVITVKHILIECADLLEIGKKCFEERSLFSLFRNVVPE